MLSVDTVAQLRFLFRGAGVLVPCSLIAINTEL